MFIIIFVLGFLTFVNSSMNPKNWDQALVKLNTRITNSIGFFRSDVDLYSPDNDYQLQQELYNVKKGQVWLITDFNKTENYEFWIDYGINYLFSIPKNKSLKSLLSSEKRCYDQWLCSLVEFTDYRTCLKKIPGCANKNKYYPRVLEPSLSRISVVSDKFNTHVYGRFILSETDSFFS